MYDFNIFSQYNSTKTKEDAAYVEIIGRLHNRVHMRLEVGMGRGWLAEGTPLDR